MLWTGVRFPPPPPFLNIDGIMIRTIQIYNRFNVSLIINEMIKPPSDSWNIISIYSWPDPPLIHENNFDKISKLGCHKYLSLDFGDLTPERIKELSKVCPSSAEHLVLFNKEHATKIIKFIEELQSDPIEADLIVHCHAGISRSGAVGLFAHYKTQVPFYDSEIRPNRWVTKVLEEVEGRSYTKERQQEIRDFLCQLKNFSE